MTTFPVIFPVHITQLNLCMYNVHFVYINNEVTRFRQTLSQLFIRLHTNKNRFDPSKSHHIRNSVYSKMFTDTITKNYGSNVRIYFRYLTHNNAQR